MTRLLQLFCLVTAAATGLLLASLSQFWPTQDLNLESRPVAAWRPELTEAAALEKSDETVAVGSENAARPIFAPTRRPFVAAPPQQETQPEPVAEAAPAPVQQFDPSQFVLKGVFRHGEDEAALIVSPQQPAGDWYKLNSEIQGWQVQKIEKNTVTLASGERIYKLEQYVVPGQVQQQ